MGWVVSSWRTERLAALLDAQAHDTAREIVAAAERDARRVGRAAQRERADAEAYLDVLERLAEEVRVAVRVQRRALRGDEVAAENVVARRDEVVAASDEVVAPSEEIRVSRRTRRASLRDSPVAELFRATTPAG